MHSSSRKPGLTLFGLIAFTLVLIGSSAPLKRRPFAEASTAQITDHTGAAISNAAIVAVQTDTGVTHTTVSSSAGEFLFQDLPLGAYSVTASFSGFQTVKTDKIMVSAGIIYTLPIVLQLSSSTTTIEVNAASIALDTTTTTQTTVIDAQAVSNMPLNGRDFTQMMQLTPGFAGYVGGGYGSLNGTRANQMNWQIDGVDNNDLWHNIPAVNQGGVSGIAGIILPLDAVDQFSAQTQAGPEGGRNPGGTINVTLRAGTNQIHGSAYYFNRNEFFGAKSPFSDTKQKVRNYNTGFSVGGPFLKDKLFAFLTFEHQRFVIGESGTATEPSVGWQNQAEAILAQQHVPVNPVMVSVLNHLWGTNVLAQDTVGVPNNFHSSDPEYGYSWNGLGKVDWLITTKDNLSVHWFVGQGNQVAPVGSQLLAFYEEAPIHVQNIAIVYDRVISSHMTNQLLAGVNYFNQVFNDNETNFDVQSLGFITGATLSNAPHIAITNFDPVGLTPPEGRNELPLRPSHRSTLLGPRGDTRCASAASLGRHSLTPSISAMSSVPLPSMAVRSSHPAVVLRPIPTGTTVTAMLLPTILPDAPLTPQSSREIKNVKYSSTPGSSTLGTPGRLALNSTSITASASTTRGRFITVTRICRSSALP